MGSVKRDSVYRIKTGKVAFEVFFFLSRLCSASATQEPDNTGAKDAASVGYDFELAG